MKHDPTNPTPADPPADPLATALAALRHASAACTAPPQVEQALMAAFATRFARKRWYQRVYASFSAAQWTLAGGLGGAAAAVLAVLILRTPLPGASGGQPLPQLEDGSPFIALASQERIEQESHPRMLEAQLQRTELAALGVPVSPETAGELVRAEMLVGADGAPLALRLSSQ